MFAPVDDLTDSTSDLTRAILSGKDAAGERSRASKSLVVDLTLEKQLQGKIAVIIKSTGAYMAYKYLKTIGDCGIAHGQMAMTALEIEQAIASLSITQRILSAVLIKHFRITQMASDATDWLSERMEGLGINTTRVLLGFMRFIVSVLTIASVILALGFMIAAVSIHFQGMDSFVLDLTENIWYLRDAMQGLVMALSGEGEGGVFDVFTAAMFTMGVVALVASFPVGLLAGALMFMAGIFHLVQNALEPILGPLGATAAAFVVAGASLGPFLLLLTKIPILGAHVAAAIEMFLVFMNSAFLFANLTWQALLYGFALIGVGIGLILFAMTNDITGWKGVVVSAVAAVAGAILIHMGLIALGITSITLGPILVVAGLLVLLYKYHDELKAIANTIWQFFTGDTHKIGVTEEDQARYYAHGEKYRTDGIRTRAMGGPVSRGRAYLVGEKGPELFTPGESGNITSNKKMSGMSGGTVNHINIKLDVSGVTDRSDKRALAREISDMLNQEVRRLGGQPTRGRF